MPDEYEIRVKGHLDEAWNQYFPQMKFTRLKNGETMITGTVPDQAALHGALERIRDLNLPLLSVVRRTDFKENDVDSAPFDI